MGLITAKSVEDYLGRAFDANETRRCEQIIDDLTDDLETHLGRCLTAGTVFTETIKLPPGRTRVWLRGYPVTSITSATLDGVALSAGTYSLDASSIGDLPVSSNALPPSILEIEYVAGVDGATLAGVASTLRRAAAREMNRTRDDTVGVDSINVEGYATRYSDAGGFSVEDLRRVSRWKRRTAL